MATARVNGIDLYYERSGNGPRLVLLNGSGGTLAGSGILLNQFREHFDLLAHDQRGLGRTGVPEGPYAMADYAADALALLDDVGWESCRVVGISFGGMVAQELAVTAPHRVERLALVCTSPGGTGGSSYPLHELADLPGPQRAAIALRILDTRFTPEWLAEHPTDQVLADAMASRSAVTLSDDETRGAGLQLEARRTFDAFGRLPAITCPTLVASGRFDGIAPPANGEAIVARVPDAELRLYDGGHAFFFQDPAAFADLREFLARP
ncbi:MAG: alpha/beta fold hydrolase [Acidimicrobiales bacterium]